MPQPSFLELWYQALNTEGGLCIRVTSGKPSYFQWLMRKSRREALDPTLYSMRLTPSPTEPNEVWIVHSEQSDTESEDAPEANPSRPSEGDDELPSIELPEDV